MFAVHDVIISENDTAIKGFLIFAFMTLILEGSQLTVCVTCVWAGVDSAWEQYKLEARKMLVNRADSHLSGARFVGQL